MLSSLQSLYLVHPTVAAGQVPALCLDHEEEDEEEDDHHQEEEEEDGDGDHDHDHDSGTVLKGKKVNFEYSIHFNIY